MSLKQVHQDEARIVLSNPCSCLYVRFESVIKLNGRKDRELLALNRIAGRSKYGVGLLTLYRSYSYNFVPKSIIAHSLAC